MSVNSDALYAYVELMRTSDSDDAFFGLLDLGQDAVPLLITEACKLENQSIRAGLIRVIRQYRDPSTLDFLGQSLNDNDPSVWKEALDGLVTIGGPDAAAWLKKTQGRVVRGEVRNGLSAEWIDEALEQIEYDE